MVAIGNLKILLKIDAQIETKHFIPFFHFIMNASEPLFTDRKRNLQDSTWFNNPRLVDQDSLPFRINAEKRTSETY